VSDHDPEQPEQPSGATSENQSGGPAGGDGDARGPGRPGQEDDRRRATRVVQGQRIVASVAGATAWPPDSHLTGNVEFFYLPQVLLVRDWNVAAISQVLDSVPIGNRSVDLPGSLTRVYLDTPIPTPVIVRWLETGGSPDDRLPDLEQPLRGFAALDHLLYTCPVFSCAADEPIVVPAGSFPVPGVDSGVPDDRPAVGRGGGVRVVVVDTGLVEGATTEHSWLVGVTGDPDDPLGADGKLGQDGGHGTFTAGCLRAAAPRAEMRVVDGTRFLARLDNATGTIGAAFEGDLAVLVRAALTDPLGSLDVPDILLVNFAGPTLDGRPPQALAALHDDLLQHLRELLVVAPAGNEGDTTRNWPAAFPWVVGVGALGANWRDRATFSNYGPTTDVFAPGTDIVNAFAHGAYEYGWPGPLQGTTVTFEGMARWSGTSFAAPLVAGLIASRMSTTGQTSHRAWLSLLDLAESQAVPGTGPVLYPGQGSGI
jgi:hypothetical protein